MKLIAHRGNFNGRNEARENSISYIEEAINNNFEVEIDLWWFNGRFFLGHDGPVSAVDLGWLNNHKPSLWIHAKHVNILPLLHDTDFNFFSHDVDDCVLTSKKYFWVYPGRTMPTRYGIAVMPERAPNWDITHAYGICSDDLSRWADFSK